MIKPKRLKKGDTVAIVSLSSGMAGDDIFKHRYELGKERLEKVFGLKVITMPNALKGSDYIYNHPESRAKDLMDAFKDKNISGIICNIGGADTIRLLPYIDYNVIKNNPKVFMGYSDTTVNHFMIYKAGVESFYGPSVMCEFAENNHMHPYTKKYINEVLFKNKENIEIKSSDKWTCEYLDWGVKENDSIERKMKKEKHGFEIIQGSGVVSGELLGGCFDVFPMMVGTEIWPSKDEWKNKILFLETSEDEPSPDFIEIYLRNLIATGVIDSVSAIIIGKPNNEQYYDEYKEIFKRVISVEAKKPNLPIIYNLNFGHTAPMCILPLGLKVKIDLDNKKIVFEEKPMED